MEADAAGGPPVASANLFAAEAQASRLADAVAARLALLQSAVAACEATLAGGAPGGGGELWARKVEQAAEETGQLQAGLARWHVQHGTSRRQSAAEARSELLRRTGVRAIQTLGVLFSALSRPSSTAGRWERRRRRTVSGG